VTKQGSAVFIACFCQDPQGQPGRLTDLYVFVQFSFEVALSGLRVDLGNYSAVLYELKLFKTNPPNAFAPVTLV
jgi:hypothetical protein